MKRSMVAIVLVCACAGTCLAQHAHGSHPYHPPAPPEPRRQASSDRKPVPPPRPVPIRQERKR